MKRFSALLLAAAVTIGSSGIAQASTSAGPDEEERIASLEAQATSAVTKAEWDRFSASLVDALTSGERSLQNAAMRLVIEYGEHVDVGEAKFDIVRIYRDGSDVQARRMAVVTLASLNDRWTTDFLQRSVRFEKSETLKKTIRAVLADRA
ncbi:MAG: hypothetical protein HKN17_02750 [Rhodothermales bacterium]|nr:hypothetical protein [Rhodothermales bacterium]